MGMHTTKHSLAATPRKDSHWSNADNQRQHNMSATCGAAATTSLKVRSEAALRCQGPKHPQNMCRYWPRKKPTLTGCKPIAKRALVQSRQPRATQHVNRIWCSTTSGTTSMKVCGTHALQCRLPHHAQNRTRQWPSILRCAHGLQTYYQRPMVRIRH